MVVSGRVADSNKKGSIQSVTVSVLDPDGMEVGHTLTNDVGYFYLKDDRITVGDTILFRHPDYFDKSVTVTGATGTGFVYMDQKPVTADRIDPVDPNKGKNLIWWIVLPLALLYVFSNKKRTKSKR